MRLHNGAIKLPFSPFLLPRDEWVNFILGKLGRRGGRATFFRDSFFFSPRNNYLSDEREAWSVESRKLRNQLKRDSGNLKHDVAKFPLHSTMHQRAKHLMIPSHFANVIFHWATNVVQKNERENVLQRLQKKKGGNRWKIVELPEAWAENVKIIIIIIIKRYKGRIVRKMIRISWIAIYSTTTFRQRCTHL